MKISIQENPLGLDVSVDEGDVLEVELQDRPHGKRVLYVSVNGRTILRISRIKELQQVGMGLLESTIPEARESDDGK